LHLLRHLLVQLSINVLPVEVYDDTVERNKSEDCDDEYLAAYTAAALVFGPGDAVSKLKPLTLRRVLAKRRTNGLKDVIWAQVSFKHHFINEQGWESVDAIVFPFFREIGEDPVLGCGWVTIGEGCLYAILNDVGVDSQRLHSHQAALFCYPAAEDGVDPLHVFEVDGGTTFLKHLLKCLSNILICRMLGKAVLSEAFHDNLPTFNIETVAVPDSTVAPIGYAMLIFHVSRTLLAIVESYFRLKLYNS